MQKNSVFKCRKRNDIIKQKEKKVVNLCANQLIHNLEDYKKAIIIVFCGEQTTNTLKEETLQNIINNAILVSANFEKSLCEKNDKEDDGTAQYSISTTMMKMKITKILCELGVPTNLLGYEYLRFAISNALTDRKYLYGITKILYPAVAKEFKTSSSGVERAIRHAIKVASNREDIEVFRKIFGNTKNPDTGKPTNSEFISKIVEILKMDVSI